MNSSQKETVKAFLQKHNLMVVSTIATNEVKTQSAVVAFAETDNLEIIFGTSNKTRKYGNLQENQNISCVIGWDSKIGTLQYEGIATEPSLEEFEKYSTVLITKNPGSAQYVHNEDQRYFLIKPTWLRLQDFTSLPAQDFTLNF